MCGSFDAILSDLSEVLEAHIVIGVMRECHVYHDTQSLILCSKLWGILSAEDYTHTSERYLIVTIRC